MAHTLARAIVCSVLLVLPSCAIPHLRLAEPGPELPGSFNGLVSANNSAQLGIDAFFNDPVLTHLIDQALAGNRELKILNEEVQIASNEVLARQGAYLPFVNFGAIVGLDRPSLFTPLGAAEKELEYLPGRHFPDPLPNYQLGLNLLWQLDIWRELRNARDAAAQRYVAVSERRNYFVTRLVAEIAENYYRLMALDKRLETLDQIIELQEESYKIAKKKMEAGRGTALAVQRFQAEVRKNQSEKLIVTQDIVEAENRINFLTNRFPQRVERVSAAFFNLKMPLSVGVPAQLLQNRADIRQAERELAAAGLDVNVARAHFFPRVDITAGVGYQAFNPKYLFQPEALIYNVAGNLVTPLLNKKAIQAEYKSANARQLEAVYNYQRVILNAFTEVVNRVAKVENYGRSIAIKKQQLESLEASVDSASKLFQNPRLEKDAQVDYLDVLLSQRDLMDARTVLIETTREQLAAIVNTYQALGGGVVVGPPRLGLPVGRDPACTP
jgi:NodT family efflux transporter outer membrane factor (OMF) lipoprotein